MRLPDLRGEAPDLRGETPDLRGEAPDLRGGLASGASGGVSLGRLVLREGSAGLQT